MKLLIRLVFATALLGAPFATPVSAQYMFLDTNGDALHTDADDLNANGTPTVATVYLITNQNEDGSVATCDQDPEIPLTINSYVVSLQAVGGQVEYSDFTNLQPTMVTNFGEVDADSVHYKNGFGGQDALDPGKYELARITITGISGSPSIEIVDIIPGSADFTSFGTACFGNDFDNTYKLAGPGGGVDWTDADGLGPGPGGNAFPTLTVPTEVVGGVGSPISITATATDENLTDVLTITYTTTAPFLTEFTHTPSVSPSTAILSGTPPLLSQGNYQVMWSVSDGVNPPVTGETSVIITEDGGPNVCPELAAIGNQTVNEEVLLQLALTATDPDPGQTLTFSLGEGAPEGASLNAGSGVFTWIPTEEQGPGEYSITFRVTDNGSPACTDSEVVVVTVQEVGGENQCPVLAPIGDRTVNEGVLLTFTATATDADPGQTLTFSLSTNAPAGATLDPSTGLFNWTPSEEQSPGVYPVTIRVFDTGQPACADSETINVTVNEVGDNVCPELALIGNRTVDELSTLTFTATATDPDAGQTLTFTLDPGFPAGASIDPNTGVFTFTPTEEQGPGLFQVTVRVTDSADPACSDFEIIQITVNEVGGGENQCPVLAPIGNQAVNELTLLTFTATATDPDAGQTLTFSLDPGFPAGATIDPSTGVFSFTPTEDQGPGTYTVTVRVSDDFDPACSDFETITITVNEVDGENQCPVVEPISDRTVDEGEFLTFTVVASDPENETLVFALGSGAPAGAQIHPLTGVFMWTPTNDQSGTYTITIQVRDTCEDPCTVTETVTIVVNDTEPENQCPTVQGIANRTVEEGQLLSLDADATDPDAGQTVTFSLDPGAPTGAMIDPVTGAFTFTPTHEQIGEHTVVVRGTDNGDPACSDTEEFRITVVEGENECPVLSSIGDRTVNEGELLTFTATATDPEDDEIIFSLDAGAPAGAMIHANTGVFTWTPTSAQGPGTYEITIRATDLCLTPCSDTETIMVTVLDVGGANECPVLEDIGDKTVNEGSLLTFTAEASDPENDEIIFSLDAGAPDGAMIHANTGVFTWTPSSNQSGTYEITIRATDLCVTPCSDTETIEVTVLEGSGGGGGSSTVLAKFKGGDEMTKLWSGKPTTCVHLEVIGDDEIDFSTLELQYDGQRIEARDASRSRDADRNGKSEGTACFSKEDLRDLFEDLPVGTHTVSIQIVGRFESGESFTANTTHQVAVHKNKTREDSVAENGNGRKKAKASPNPINPSTVLSFGTTREGSVKIQVYDLAGRLVRTLYDGTMPAGANSVAWDGTGGGGGRVSSGVYYLRVLSVDGQDVVRVTVLK